MSACHAFFALKSYVYGNHNIEVDVCLEMNDLSSFHSLAALFVVLYVCVVDFCVAHHEVMQGMS